MIQLICPHCGDLLTLPASFAGTVGRCRHCKQQVVVPIQPIIAPPPGQDFFDHISSCVDAAKSGRTVDHDWVPSKSPPMLYALRWKTIMGLALLLLMAVLLAGYASIQMGRAKDAREKARKEQSRKAYVGAQDAVRGAIKHPSTLEFPAFELASVLGPYGNGKYIVSGYCDTTNETGKKLRTNYRCTVRLENGVWQCDSINLTEYLSHPKIVKGPE